MTRKTRGRGRTKHSQRLHVSGLTFSPAKVSSEGTRRGRSTTKLTFETDELTDPANLLELIATVQNADLKITITPDDSDPWEGFGEISATSVKSPSECGAGRYSVVSISVLCPSDDPQSHLDLFRTRLAMDGRDSWEALVNLRLIQGDFTLPGEVGDYDPANDEDPPK